MEEDNGFNLEKAGQWITRAIMLCIAIIGFFVVKLINDVENRQEKQAEKQEKQGGRLTVIEAEILPTLRILINQTQENKSEISEINKSRYRSEDAKKEKEITDLKIQIIEKNLTRLEEKVDLKKN